LEPCRGHVTVDAFNQIPTVGIPGELNGGRPGDTEVLIPFARVWIQDRQSDLVC
jgi:hypothetical protein